MRKASEPIAPIQKRCQTGKKEKEKGEQAHFPVLPPFFCEAKKAVALLVQWIKDLNLFFVRWKWSPFPKQRLRKIQSSAIITRRKDIRWISVLLSRKLFYKKHKERGILVQGAININNLAFSKHDNWKKMLVIMVSHYDIEVE